MSKFQIFLCQQMINKNTSLVDIKVNRKINKESTKRNFNYIWKSTNLDYQSITNLLLYVPDLGSLNYFLKNVHNKINTPPNLIKIYIQMITILSCILSTGSLQYENPPKYLMSIRVGSVSLP